MDAATLSDASSRRVGRKILLALLCVLALYAIARLALGPIPQDPTYHLFADQRTVLGVIPHAGDVLTNLSILAAGLLGFAMQRRMHVTPDERPAVRLLIAGTFLTAAGSMYYHWAPSNATLALDRLPMMLVLAPVLVLVLADRVHPTLAPVTLWPLAALATASVLWWTVSEAVGREDVLLYLMVRVLAPAAILLLLLLRPSRHTRSAWLIAALVCEGILFVCERLDHPIYAATGGFASGHNLKHLLVGVALGCVFAWLRLRRPRESAGRANT